MREAWAYARQGLLIARPLHEYQLHAPSRALTVFVHGYFAGGGVFDPMSRWLASEGIATRQLHFTYGLVGSVRALAERMARRIEAVGDRGGPVHFVGHSLGGVIGRYYAQMLGGRIDRMVCLATPHRGTLRAQPWTAIPLAREIAPGSETLACLDATRGRLRSVRLCSILAGDDAMILPSDSAALEGHEVVRLRGVGHQSLLFDRAAWGHVARVLGE